MKTLSTAFRISTYYRRTIKDSARIVIFPPSVFIKWISIQLIIFASYIKLACTWESSGRKSAQGSHSMSECQGMSLNTYGYIYIYMATYLCILITCLHRSLKQDRSLSSSRPLMTCPFNNNIKKGRQMFLINSTHLRLVSHIPHTLHIPCRLVGCTTVIAKWKTTKQLPPTKMPLGVVVSEGQQRSWSLHCLAVGCCFLPLTLPPSAVAAVEWPAVVVYAGRRIHVRPVLLPMHWRVQPRPYIPPVDST